MAICLSVRLWIDIITVIVGFVSNGYIKKTDDQDHNTSENTLSEYNIDSQYHSTNTNTTYSNSTSLLNNRTEGNNNQIQIIDNISADVFASIFCILCFISLILKIVNYKQGVNKKALNEVSLRIIANINLSSNIFKFVFILSQLEKRSRHY